MVTCKIKHLRNICKNVLMLYFRCILATSKNALQMFYAKAFPKMLQNICKTFLQMVCRGFISHVTTVLAKKNTWVKMAHSDVLGKPRHSSRCSLLTQHNEISYNNNIMAEKYGSSKVHLQIFPTTVYSVQPVLACFILGCLYYRNQCYRYINYIVICQF